MIQRLAFIAACVVGLTLSFAAGAQQYQINWHTIDGGGGTSTSQDGVYSLSGTIGQPDADVVSLCSADGGAGCTNPTYELTGGFWAGIQSGSSSSPTCNGALNCIFRNGFEL